MNKQIKFFGASNFSVGKIESKISRDNKDLET
jgi:hypothetical protein